jgi:protein-S-isoprenylcysteine O-methyltransferase Ste14
MDEAEPASPRSRALGVLRLAVVWAFGAAVAWFARPSVAEWAVGVVLAAAGESLRVWAAGYLVKSKVLITAGPYAHVRNPLYLGRLLIGSGIGVAAVFPAAGFRAVNLVVLAVVYAIFFGYYMPRKERVEPARLEKRHGEDYRRYRAAVRSLLPRLAPYDRPNGTWGWHRFGRNREALMVAGLTALFGALAFRAFAN